MSQPLNLIHDALVFVDDGIVRTLKRHKVPKVAGVSSVRVAVLMGSKNMDLKLFSVESVQEGLHLLAGVLSSSYNADLITIEKNVDGFLQQTCWSKQSSSSCQHQRIYIYHEEGKEWEALIPPPVGEAHYVVEVGRTYQLTFILDTKERNVHITKITATHIEGRDEEGSNSWFNDRLLCVEVNETKIPAAWVELKEGEETFSILNSQEQAEDMDGKTTIETVGPDDEESLFGVYAAKKVIEKHEREQRKLEDARQLVEKENQFLDYIKPIPRALIPKGIDLHGLRWRARFVYKGKKHETSLGFCNATEYYSKYEEVKKWLNVKKQEVRTYEAQAYDTESETEEEEKQPKTITRNLPANVAKIKAAVSLSTRATPLVLPPAQNLSVLTQKPEPQLRPRTTEIIPSGGRSQATIHPERNEFGVELSMPQQNVAISTSLNGLLDPPEITNSAFFSGLTPLSVARRNLNTNISTIQTIHGDLDCSKSTQNSINNLVSCVFQQNQPEYTSIEPDCLKAFDDEIQNCNSPLFSDPEPLAPIVSQVPIGSLRVPTPKRTGTPHSFHPMADQAASPISTVSGSELVDGFRTAAAKRNAPEIKKPQPIKKQKPMQALLPNVMRSVVVGSVSNVTQTPLASIVAPASIRPALGLLGSVPNVTPANLQLNLTSKALASCLVALPGFKSQLPEAKAEPFLVESVLNAIVLKDPGFLDALFIEIRQYPLSGATLAKQVIDELLWPTVLTLSYNP